MPIASALRRKRDDVAATIAAYEARIEAARWDLAALDRAARHSISKPNAIPRDLDRLRKAEEFAMRLWKLAKGGRPLPRADSLLPSRGCRTSSVISGESHADLRLGGDTGGIFLFLLAITH
jgi:hypothetical protein